MEELRRSHDMVSRVRAYT